ncbi:MAG: hypothetical protein Q9166_001585 [cf. Caloplaca sp. 2 TL-2023]
MAPSRAFSFPLSHVEEESKIPPFAVSNKDESKLRSCKAFQIIRGLLLDREEVEFCHLHNIDSRKDKEAWLLQRDITYALIVPVLEIYRHATRIAKALLGNRHIFDLELVFRGEARGAFSWLQCFVMEEEDWCLTRGCPGCVVTHVLVAEPTIRLILVACHLSSALHQPQHHTNSPPLLDFWRHSLKKALDEDPFWGPDLWRTFESRAKALESGIEELVKQCVEFAPLVAANVAVQDNCSPPQSPEYGVLKLPQTGVQGQQTDWIPSIAMGCWTTLLADAEEAKRTVSPTGNSIKALCAYWDVDCCTCRSCRSGRRIDFCQGTVHHIYTAGIKLEKRSLGGGYWMNIPQDFGLEEDFAWRTVGHEQQHLMVT